MSHPLRSCRHTLPSLTHSALHGRRAAGSQLLPFLKLDLGVHYTLLTIIEILAAFLGLCLISALAGFSPSNYAIPSYKQSDKVLHFVAFFFVTVTFYWVLDTNRRKVVQVTFAVCTLGLGLVSELVQSLLPVRVHHFKYEGLTRIANVPEDWP